MNQYCYANPHPAVTTDVVVFSVEQRTLKVLLVKRSSAPFKGRWALPGSFINIDEDIDLAAQRELHQETGLGNVYLEQLYTFGAPQRDPRERVITVAYFALVPWERVGMQHQAQDAAALRWFDLEELPSLAFDHTAIVDTARERVSAKTKYSTVALQLMPSDFTLSDLQSVYEVLLGEALDKRNFRKWILSLDCIHETGEQRRNGQHRPAKLYRATHPARVEIIK